MEVESVKEQVVARLEGRVVDGSVKWPQSPEVSFDDSTLYFDRGMEMWSIDLRALFTKTPENLIAMVHCDGYVEFSIRP